jgi:hypothetical protein
MQAVVAADSHLGVVPPDVGPSAHAWAHANVDPRIRRLQCCSGVDGVSGQRTADGAGGPSCDDCARLKVVDGDTVDIRGWTVHTVVATLD